MSVIEGVEHVQEDRRIFIQWEDQENLPRESGWVIFG
jgi:hypothetical protein